MKISPAQSAYLDFLRFVAALAVLLGHMKQNGFDMAWMPLARFSHEAVVVFFVMSGFIVYTSTAARRGDFRRLVNRRRDVNHMVELRACDGIRLDALGPGDGHWVAHAAEVGAHQFGALIRRSARRAGWLSGPRRRPRRGGIDCPKSSAKT